MSASVNVFAVTLSIMKSEPDNLMLLPASLGGVVGVVVVTSSFGSTTKFTVILCDNVSFVTVNVIGKIPPVSVTALNASN